MKPSPRPSGSGTVKILPHSPRNVSFYPIICGAHLSKDDIGLLPILVITSFIGYCSPRLRRRASLWGFVFFPLETVFSEVSKLLTVITLDSPLIRHLSPSLKEPLSRGKWRLLPRGIPLVRVFVFGYMEAYLLAFFFFVDLANPSPICRGVHGIWIVGGLVLISFEGVVKLHPSFLFASVLEVQPFCVSFKCGCLPLLEVSGSIHSDHFLV